MYFAYSIIALLSCSLATQAAVRRDTAVLASRVTAGFRDNCYAKPSGGCKCEVKEGHDEVTIREYDDVEQCKKPVEVQTALNKMALNKEILEKFGDFKENCFPKPSGGCKCNVDLGQGETVIEYSEPRDCRKSVEAQTAENKEKLNKEIEEKFGNFKDNCFPKPSGGCKCTEKDANGNEVTNSYNTAEQCRELIPPSGKSKRDVGVQAPRQPSQLDRDRYAPKDRSRSPSVERPSQNVRDPVREKAQANYALVLDELHNKFKGLKEGCFPRPKGCLCVTGKTAEGRAFTLATLLVLNLLVIFSAAHRHHGHGKWAQARKQGHSDESPKEWGWRKHHDFSGKGEERRTPMKSEHGAEAESHHHRPHYRHHHHQQAEEGAENGQTGQFEHHHRPHHGHFRRQHSQGEGHHGHGHHHGHHGHHAPHGHHHGHHGHHHGNQGHHGHRGHHGHHRLERHHGHHHGEHGHHFGGKNHHENQNRSGQGWNQSSPKVNRTGSEQKGYGNGLWNEIKNVLKHALFNTQVNGQSNTTNTTTTKNSTHERRNSSMNHVQI